MDKIALLISPHFPPSQPAGVHRARHMAKYLPHAGWQPIVLTIDERFQNETVDPTLARLIPSQLEVCRVKALPLWMTRPVGIGDLTIRAFHQMRRELDRLIAEVDPRVVFFTGSPFYHMLHAGRVRHFGIPVVLDFQDPWVSAYGATRPQWSKEGLAHRLAGILEPIALRSATYVTSVSDEQNCEMAERYPWLDRSRMAAIPIGGDPEDFDALRALSLQNPQVRFDPDKINLSYVGTFLPRAESLVRHLFRAFARFCEEKPELCARIRLNFVGTSNQPDERKLFRVLPIAAEEGVSSYVNETPRRVPFLESLSLMANSNGLLLIGSDEPHYTASKIYPALMSGRPYLSIFHRSSSSHEILSTAGGGRALAFSKPEQLEMLEPEMMGALAALAAAPQQFGRPDPSAYAAYEAGAIARRYAKIFDEIATSPDR